MNKHVDHTNNCFSTYIVFFIVMIIAMLIVISNKK